MIRAIIIDDEVSALNVLSIILKDGFAGQVEVTATASSPFKGIKLIEKTSPDLVFLDIEMPGMSGLDLMRHFPDPSFRVVFVTAYDTYAIDAFRLCAIDYLLKPVDENEIRRVIQKIEKELSTNENTLRHKLNHLEELMLQNNTGTESRIGISMTDKIVFINIHDILYCEAKGSYTHIYFHDGKKMVSSRPLCEFELQLAGHKFFRIHNSSLINLNRIKEFQRHDGGFVILENGMRLEISQRKRKGFLAAIEDIIV